MLYNNISSNQLMMQNINISPQYKKTIFIILCIIIKNISYIYTIIRTLKDASNKLMPQNITNILNTLSSSDDHHIDTYLLVIAIIIVIISKNMIKKMQTSDISNIKTKILNYRYIVIKNQILNSNNKKEDVNYAVELLNTYMNLYIRIYNNVIEFVNIISKVIIYCVACYMSTIFSWNKEHVSINYIRHILCLLSIVIIIPFVNILIIYGSQTTKKNNINLFKRYRFFNNNHLHYSQKYNNDGYVDNNIAYCINNNSSQIFNIILSVILYMYASRDSIIKILAILNLIFYNSGQNLLYLGYDIYAIKQYNQYIQLNDIDAAVIYDMSENIDITIAELIVLFKSNININLIIYQLTKMNVYYVNIDANMYISNKVMPFKQRQAIFKIIMDNSIADNKIYIKPREVYNVK